MLLNNYRAKKIIPGTAIVPYCNLKANIPITYQNYPALVVNSVYIL